MATLSQLQYIVSVANLRHFGKAADACHISQPSLSMQIQKVEEEFDILLFDRNKKPIEITPQGQLFVEQAKAVLREHEKLVHLAQEKFNPLSGEFRLGVIPTLAPYILPLFLRKFSKSYPKVQLLIDELKTEEIIDALKNDALDAAILATPLKERGLREKVLFYEPFYLYTSPDHPLSKKQKIANEDLTGEDLWLLQDGHCFRNQVVSFCTSPVEGEKQVQFKGGNFETLRLILQSNYGYTLFPQLFVDTFPSTESRKSVRPFKDPQPTREVSLVYRRGQWKKEILDALETTLKSQIPDTVYTKPSPSFMVLPIA